MSREVSFPLELKKGESIDSPSSKTLAQYVRVTAKRAVRFRDIDEFYDYCEGESHPDVIVEVISKPN